MNHDRVETERTEVRMRMRRSERWRSGCADVAKNTPVQIAGAVSRSGCRWCSGSGQARRMEREATISSGGDGSSKGSSNWGFGARRRKGWVGEDAEGRLYGWKGEGQWQRQAVERKWGGLGVSGTEAVAVKADQQGRMLETRRDASEQGNRGLSSVCTRSLVIGVVLAMFWRCSGDVLAAAQAVAATRVRRGLGSDSPMQAEASERVSVETELGRANRSAQERRSASQTWPKSIRATGGAESRAEPSRRSSSSQRAPNAIGIRFSTSRAFFGEPGDSQQQGAAGNSPGCVAALPAPLLAAGRMGGFRLRPADPRVQHAPRLLGRERRV
ncbi:hypothetical protein L1887_57498 [Cichorium endivia]|nr:hypothetical protein L1887_57498 [Cichorium endivia]